MEAFNQWPEQRPSYSNKYPSSSRPRHRKRAYPLANQDDRRSHAYGAVRGRLPHIQAVGRNGPERGRSVHEALMLNIPDSENAVNDVIYQRGSD